MAPGMDAGYVVKDAAKLELDTERDASKFDVMYCRRLLEKAWDEVALSQNCQLIGAPYG